MENSSLISLIKTFSKQELKEFLLFVKSPFFNNEKVLVRFAEILSEANPDFKKTKEESFSELYGGKKYNDGLMRNVLSDLLKLAEKYLTYKEFTLSRTDQKIKLISQLSKRHLNKSGSKHIETLNDLTEKEKIRNSSFYLIKFEAEKMIYNYLQNSKDKYIRELKYDKLIENLLTYFMINLIELYSSMLSRKKIIEDTEVTLFLQNEIDNIIDGVGFSLLKVPYINAYYNIYKLMKEEDEKYFFELKKIIYGGLDEIAEIDKVDLFSAASNFAYLKVLSGDMRFIKEQYEIITASIRNNAHVKRKGYLPVVQFMNAVITGLEINKIKESEKFIEEYKDRLFENYRESAVHFCTALINYKKKKYDYAITELSKVETEDFSFRQQIKSLYLKIYFELNESEPFYFHVDSYRHFISENKLIHSVVRRQLSDYLKFTKKLFALKSITQKSASFELKKLEEEIKKSPTLINRKWLLEKIEEIDNLNK